MNDRGRASADAAPADRGRNGTGHRTAAAGSPPARSAAEMLQPVIYEQLRSIAAAYMQHERPDHTLQPTAVVHEAFLRLADPQRTSFAGEAQFLRLAAETIRHVLVDHARRHGAARRGGGAHRVTLDERLVPHPGGSTDLLGLHEALERLARTHPRAAAVAEGRFFGGMTEDHLVEVLGVSRKTIVLDWKFARAWLSRELGR
jgi:RNA polymerase sigma factor (TIGR02999 family)